MENQKLDTEQQRKEFLEICKKFFEEFGKELNSENGEKLPKDTTTTNDIALRQGWSINVTVLSPYGLHPAYYRGADPNFTVNGLSFRDLYVRDCGLLTNKYITQEQLNTELKPLISHLEITE